ncbi:hypothetical protein [Streptomyces sp. NPDC051286]|uniref:hypothetical protein n=1 Tax=Streptomyces sp. NPDC051286 TaxID=3365647 RepID=UPI0037B4488B
MPERHGQGPPATQGRLGEELRVVRQGADSGRDLTDPLRIPGVHGRFGSGEQAPGTLIRLRREFRGAFQRRGRGRVSAATPRAFRALRESAGDLIVRAECGCGEMPGTAIGFVRERGGERQVGLAALGERSGLVDRGADQRMTQTHVTALDAHQPRLFGGPPHLRPVQAGHGVENVRELGAAGCRRQEQDPACVVRQGGQVGGEQVLQSRREGGTSRSSRIRGCPDPWRRLV